MPENFAARPFSLDELLAHAMAIETEAVESYEDLAAQMRQCGNGDVAELFQRMRALEAEHAARLREKAGDAEIAGLAPWEYRWLEPEAPENVDLAGIHYLMTPHHALTLALENETRALAFFEAVTDNSADARTRSLAMEFADDERQHVAWMKEWLVKYPEPDADWDFDPDPPPAID